MPFESALWPGHFIGWNQEASFVSGLHDAEHDIAALTATIPCARRLSVRTFIVACNTKAEEIYSEWEFGNSVAGLSCGWIQSRQAAGANPEMSRSKCV